MSGEEHAVDVDDVVHQRNRLAVLSLLNEVRRAEFMYIRDALGLSDGNLGRHVEVLRAKGLVGTDRQISPSGRPRMWVSITREGRTAFRAEIEALRALVRRFDTTGS
ncbi:transcriptional regulator [Streptomyces avidinii]|uniref:transcriptional regulator n=1 Tax=Streptomyces avidinii TaxID=1895 RepID=UPI0037A275CD